MRPAGRNGAQDFAGLPVDLDKPPISPVRHIARLGTHPKVAAGSDLERKGLAEVAPFADVAALHSESLDAAVLAISHIQDVVAVDRDSVRQMELAGSGPGLAPLPNAFAFGVIFENARITVAVGDEDAASGREGDIGRSAE